MSEMAANLSLVGKRVLITGGARGLGAEFAAAAVAAGARVAIADVLAERGRETAKRLTQGGGEAHFVALDLTDPASIEQCVASTIEALGGLDGLVNNAAVTDSGGKAFDELDIDVWDRVMNVNVRGTW